MTLEKSISAAREAMKLARASIYSPEDFDKALSTLPTKPMTEDEIMKIVSMHVPICSDGLKIELIRALRDAGVLYVGEK